MMVSSYSPPDIGDRRDQSTETSLRMLELIDSQQASTNRFKFVHNNVQSTDLVIEPWGSS